MRRIYLLVLAVVLVATLVGLAISEQAGYVLIAYKSFRYESSLWSFLEMCIRDSCRPAAGPSSGSASR